MVSLLVPWLSQERKSIEYVRTRVKDLTKKGEHREECVEGKRRAEESSSLLKQRVDSLKSATAVPYVQVFLATSLQLVYLFTE